MRRRGASINCIITLRTKNSKNSKNSTKHVEYVESANSEVKLIEHLEDEVSVLTTTEKYRGAEEGDFTDFSVLNLRVLRFGGDCYNSFGDSAVRTPQLFSQDVTGMACSLD